VTGPLDVIGTAPVGALNQDLRQACLDALAISRDACRAHALGFSWARSATQFLTNLHPICVEAAHEVPTSARAGVFGDDAEQFGRRRWSGSR
jgi:hypothetical protein